MILIEFNKIISYFFIYNTHNPIILRKRKKKRKIDSDKINQSKCNLHVKRQAILFILIRIDNEQEMIDFSQRLTESFTFSAKD